MSTEYMPIVPSLIIVYSPESLHVIDHDNIESTGRVFSILYHLLEGLNPRWIGSQYDVRHATAEGGKSWQVGMKLLSPFIRTTVIKDFRWEKKGGKWKDVHVPLGEGMVDFKQYFKLVKSLNIGGPISMHFEYPVYDKANKNLSQKERRRQTIEIMKKDLQKLRSMLKKAGLD